jgi:hypothetical protein
MKVLFVVIFTCMAATGCNPSTGKTRIPGEKDTMAQILTIDHEDSAYNAFYSVDSLRGVTIDTHSMNGKVNHWWIRQILTHQAIDPDDKGMEPEPEVTTADINGDGIPELLAEENCMSCGTGNYNYCQSVYFMDAATQLFEDTPRIELSNPVWCPKEKKVYSYYRAVPFISGEAYHIAGYQLDMFEKVEIDEDGNGGVICERKNGSGRSLFKKRLKNFDMMDTFPFPSYKANDRKPFGVY